MKTNTEKLIAKIENYIKNGMCDSVNESKSTSVVSQFGSDEKKKIEDYLKGIKKPQSQTEYVCEKLKERGFVYDDGQLNFVRFYTHARISPDVWHTFITEKHKPSDDTMFKIVFGLRLDEEEAVFFLGLGGITFKKGDVLHKYILACINTGIYDPDEVYEVLEFYNVHNIYAEKKMRKDCK